jgi:hypothetical protein
MANPPESMISTIVRVAAVRLMGLEPQRKAEILARVKQLRTPEEALAFVKDAAARIEASRLAVTAVRPTRTPAASPPPGE